MWRSCAPRQQCERDRLVGLVFGKRRGGVVLDVPQHALQDAADGPCRRAFAVEANDLGHEVEASLDGPTYIAGGDSVFPARVQRGKEVEARIAGERSGIDRQPRSSRVIGPGSEDVPLAEISVQEAIPWFGEDLAQRCRALDEQRALRCPNLFSRNLDGKLTRGTVMLAHEDPFGRDRVVTRYAPAWNPLREAALGCRR